jgi:hypothetical protein
MLAKNDPLLRWTITAWSQTDTVDGVRFSLTTNHPCHLHILWTSQCPWKHVPIKKTRGADVGKKVYFCCVANTAVWQEEAGDTLLHTIIVEPWAACTTRWYRFLGTVQGQDSPSSSPCFELHHVAVIEPVTAYFYPDKHPEVTCLDGYTRYSDGWANPWSDIHDHEGNYADNAAGGASAGIWSGFNENAWREINRINLLFDTSSIPLGSNIISAELRVWGQAGYGYYHLEGLNYTVVESFPDSDVELVPTDYQKYYTSPWSDVKTQAQLGDVGYHTFIFNALGCGFIIRGGITKMGIREYSHDCLNNPPVWVYFASASFGIETADAAYPPRLPRLKIVYLPPA